VAELLEIEAGRGEGASERGAVIAADVVDCAVDCAVERRMRGHEHHELPAGLQPRVHVAQRADVVADVLEHVEAERRVELALDVRNRAVHDGDALVPGEAFAELRRLLRVRLDRDDLLRRFRKQRGERPNPRADVEHARPEVGPRTREEPGVVALRGLHPRELGTAVRLAR